MIEMSKKQEAEELLSRNRVGRLGCVLEDGGPYVVPVNYLYRDGNVYIHSHPGQKISAMKANNKVCLQTDQISYDGFTWQSVIAFGEFQVVSDKDEIDRLLDAMFDRFPGFTPVEADIDRPGHNRDPIVFRITVHKITGVTEKS